MGGSDKLRIDERLVRDGLAESRARAQRVVMAGAVRIDGQVAAKSSVIVRDAQQVEVLAGPRFVSRGGDKLANALDDLSDQIREHGLTWADARAIDIGASTGGFTDCLLQRGARHVVAVDVGYGQLHQTLRSDPRVTVMERTNARHLELEQLPWAPELLVCDASFIPLATVLPATIELMRPEGWWGVLLCKPQFEAGRERLAKHGRKGVIVDAQVREQIVAETEDSVRGMGVELLATVRAHPPGPKGNVEYALLVRGPAVAS